MKSLTCLYTVIKQRKLTKKIKVYYLYQLMNIHSGQRKNKEKFISL